MENYDELYQKWRVTLNNVALLSASVIFLLEILISFLMIQYLPDLIALPINQYIFLHIILPSAINYSLVLFGKSILKSEKIPKEILNYISILVFTGQIFIISFIHKMFPYIIILFSIPLLFTFLFSDRKMTNNIFIVNTGFLLLSLVFSLLEPLHNTLLSFIDFIIFLFIYFSFYVVTVKFIKVEKLKSKIIKSCLLKQYQLEELIKCDPLTGLYNMAAFYNELKSLIESKEEPLTIAVVDVDNFKSINDAWGHEKGNEVLITFASKLQYYCSDLGQVFRYGGEEFAIIFRDTSSEQAKKMIEAAQKELYEHVFDFMPNRRITFSCGIASCPLKCYGTGYTAHDFFELADKIMYNAKLKGKNMSLTEADVSIYL